MVYRSPSLCVPSCGRCSLSGVEILTRWSHPAQAPLTPTGKMTSMMDTSYQETLVYFLCLGKVTFRHSNRF